MIKLPYYNDHDVAILPFKAEQNGTKMSCSGFSMTFEKGDAKSIYFRTDLDEGSYAYQKISITCGDFSGMLNYSSRELTGDLADTGIDISSAVATGEKTYMFGFSQVDDGLRVEIKAPGITLDKVYSGKKIGDLQISHNDRPINLSNIVCSTDKNALNFSSSQDVRVDSIDDWELNSNNEYILTNIDSTGTVHINREIIDKILADNDIISCAVVMTTEKRGTKLKEMEFTVGDTKNSVEIPSGKSGIVIPLEFKNGTDMKDITLSVRG